MYLHKSLDIDTCILRKKIENYNDIAPVGIVNL